MIFFIVTLVSVVFGIGLDFFLGDPESKFHPVVLVGKTAAMVEEISRKSFTPFFAGLVSWSFLVIIPTLLLLALASLVYSINLFLGVAFNIVLGSILVWISIAPKSLIEHAALVRDALYSENIDDARLKLARIVGRKTENLDRAAIVRASVETLAESFVDGILAPLFWAIVLGPIFAFSYRIINTLDSIFGHKTEKYKEFGYVSAKADDIANYLPARFSIVPICLAAFFLRLPVLDTIKVFLKDRRKHESPNSAHSEAAFAGALGLQLAGPLEYEEGMVDKPFIGEGDFSPLDVTVQKAINLTIVSTVCGTLVLLLVRIIFFTLLNI